MNEELQRQLAEMLAKLTMAVEGGAAWAGEQIPPLVAEKILFGRIWHSLMAVMGVALIALSYKFCRATFRSIEAANNAARYEEGSHVAQAFAYGIGTVITIIAGTLMTVDNTYHAILALAAPRLYVVEWLIELVKPAVQ